MQYVLCKLSKNHITFNVWSYHNVKICFNYNTRRDKLTLAGSDVLDWEVAPRATIGLSQWAEIAVSASVERADWSLPHGGECRLGRRSASLPGDARSTHIYRTAADAVQQRDAVHGTYTPWLTVAHSTHLVRAASAALESVTWSCVYIATGHKRLQRGLSNKQLLQGRLSEGGKLKYPLRPGRGRSDGIGAFLIVTNLSSHFLIN